MIKENGFGDKIRQIRTVANLTMAEFAKQIGVSEGTVSLWESGKAVPRKTTITLITKLYNLNEDWLLTSEGAAVAGEDTAGWECLARAERGPKGPPEEMTSVNVYPLSVARDPNAQTGIEVAETLILPAAWAKAAPIGLKVPDDLAQALEPGTVAGLAWKDRTAKNGGMYLLRFLDGAVVIKRVFLQPGGRLLLRARRDDFPDMIVETGGCVILGRIGWTLQRL